MLARKLGCPDIVLGPRCHLRGLAYMRIGRNFQAGEGLWLEAVSAHLGQTFYPSIVIGNNVSISHWSHIASTHRVEIGDGTLIGSKVLITDHNHGKYQTNWDPTVPPSERPLDSDRPVRIGKNVWIGDGAIITAGSVLEDGCVIGANAVVSGTIPSNCIATGVPARWRA